MEAERLSRRGKVALSGIVASLALSACGSKPPNEPPRCPKGYDREHQIVRDPELTRVRMARAVAALRSRVTPESTIDIARVARTNFIFAFDAIFEKDTHQSYVLSPENKVDDPEELFCSLDDPHASYLSPQAVLVVSALKSVGINPNSIRISGE